jgi:hypothetical protein
MTDIVAGLISKQDSEAAHVAQAREFHRGMADGRFGRKPSKRSPSYDEGRQRGREELECYRKRRRLGGEP